MKTLRRISFLFLGIYCSVWQYVIYRTTLLETDNLSKLGDLSNLKDANNESENAMAEVGDAGDDGRRHLNLTPVQILVKETLADAKKNGRDVIPLPPEPTMGAFLHIGKTGGSTIQQLLRNGCSYSMRKPCKSYEDWPESKENIISKLTTYYHTNEFIIKLSDDDKKANYKFFVITLRDPLQRAISSFLYSHPSNRAYEGLMHFPKRKRFGIMKSVKRDLSKALKIVEKNPSYVQQDSVKLYTCFESLEDWAQKLENFTDYEWKEWKDYHDQGDCVNVAKSTLHHSNPWQAMGHNYWDLRAAMWRVGDWTNRTILAVRTEFLWRDWISAHRWLGEEGQIFAAGTVKNSTEGDLPIKRQELSEGARKNLCLALKEEYRLYWKVLTVAENISEEDIAKSLEISRKNCPWLDFSLPAKDEPLVFSTEGIVSRNGKVKEKHWEF